MTFCSINFLEREGSERNDLFKALSSSKLENKFSIEPF